MVRLSRLSSERVVIGVASRSTYAFTGSPLFASTPAVLGVAVVPMPASSVREPVRAA